MLLLLRSRRRRGRLGFRLRGRTVRHGSRRRRFCRLRTRSRFRWLRAPPGRCRRGIGPRRRRSRLRCGLCGRNRFPHGFGSLCRLRSGSASRSRLGAIRLRVRCRRSRGRRRTSRRASRNYRRDWFAFGNRLRRCKKGWTAFIDRGKLLAVLCRRLPRLQLRVHWGNTLLARCCNFRRQRLARDASRPVVALSLIHI